MGRKKTIVHVVHSLDVGGLENGLVNLLNQLDCDRFKHVVCCLARAGRFAERIQSSNVEVVELNIPTTGFRLPWLRLAKHFRALGADVVHTRGWPTIDATFAAKFAGISHIIHGEHGREYSDPNGTNWKRNQIRQVVGKLVDRYVIVCKFFREWLSQSCRIQENKIVYIPNGVDTRSFHPLDINRCTNDENETFGVQQRRLRQKLGLPSHVLLVGTVGRLDPVKDIPTVMNAFKNIRPIAPAAKLVVVGDGPMRARLVDLAQSIGLDTSVIWLGERRDIPDILRCLDVFVQASIFEGMSNTILEAMSSGLPIIATATGGNPELVEAGTNGALISVADVEGLSECLRRYVVDEALRKDHGAASRKRVSTEFDLSLMVARYSELYDLLACD
jgi:sugar transferase (PEP-CTERM/EpsH1 system associated)